ncbi:hypothetical protein BO85DRAFT_496991 [Aspergillus piperis CBS 112811]|uniref:Uncharacterized protein n=1 Tax=Aspergillus piperis CBS 112811 TaxID=1448313 RepID=A0A8G1QZ57_9EURO|nr:hypothetical protein BO85DRAFT_496991 [Aspergillus piperis CBS 112811]RAH56313.1 hypothetical protein BO85DRAFT_496991 [Aspergillus piperis CBS 112811]
MPIAEKKTKERQRKPPNHRPPDPPTNNPREPFPTQIPSIASVASPEYHRYPVSVDDNPDPPPTLNAIRSIASVILGDASAQTPGAPETSVAAGSEMPAARKHPRVSRYESMLVNLSPARSFVDGVQCRLSLGPVTWPSAPRTSQPKLLHPRWTQGLHRIEPWPRGIEGEDVVRGATGEREEGVGIDERVDVALGATEEREAGAGMEERVEEEEGEDVVRGATGEREEGRGIEEREDVVRGATEGEERGEVALWPLALVFWGAEGEDVVRGATGERAIGTGIERVEVGCFSSNLFRNDAPAERGRGEGVDVALATGERGAGVGMEERETGGVDKCLLVRKYLEAVGAGTPEREDVLTMVGTDGAERTEGRAESF